MNYLFLKNFEQLHNACIKMTRELLSWTIFMQIKFKN